MSERRELRLEDDNAILVISQERPHDLVDLRISEGEDPPTVYMLSESDTKMLIGFLGGTL